MRKMSQQKADSLLGRLDHLAATIQDKYAAWGIPLRVAKTLVNAVDQVADELETSVYGEESLESRKEEVAKEASSRKAQVIQRETDEPYMDTFKNPMQPHQVNTDEKYMDLYKDDQSSGVGHGETTTRRKLVPQY
jgi:hypothetical protein